MGGLPVESLTSVFGGVLALAGLIYSLEAFPGIRRGFNRWLGFVLFGAAVAAAVALLIALLIVLLFTVTGGTGRVTLALAVWRVMLLFIFLSALVISLALAYGGRLEPREKVSTRTNRILLGVAVALVPVSMVLLTVTEFAAPWNRIITLTAMSCGFLIGMLINVDPAGPRYLRWFFVLLAYYLLVIIAPIAILLLVPEIYGPGSIARWVVEHGVSVFTTTMLGVVTPGLLGYVLANRSRIGEPSGGGRTHETPAVRRFVLRFLAGLAIGLIIPLIAIITRLHSLMFAGALLGFFFAAAQGEGRRLLGEPRIPAIYDPASGRPRLRYDPSISWRRFRRGLLVLGGYTWMITLLDSYVERFPSIQGTSALAELGMWSYLVIGLVAYPFGAALVIGVPVGAFYAWGPYLAARLRDMSARAFAAVGAGMTAMGILVSIMPALIGLATG